MRTCGGSIPPRRSKRFSWKIYSEHQVYAPRGG
nr:MAG TPA: hypothetical protein [Caudoviricetes sp.]